jgi:7,8-dihydropterin-6-yl-methyl-4-(beta-D-ribofuranosyl)aminobenzene 5'-phosphate synthase
MLVEGKMVQDDFRHEQYLLIREGGRRILISGCSHKGILNIMDWFRPDVLIGGFHFMNIDPDEEGREILSQRADALLSYPAVYYTCHCTGVPQYEYLKTLMGDRLHYLSCGQALTLPL